MPYKVENIVRKGEIACSHNVLQSYIYQNAALCGYGLTNVMLWKPLTF